MEVQNVSLCFHSQRRSIRSFCARIFLYNDGDSLSKWSVGTQKNYRKNQQNEEVKIGWLKKYGRYSSVKEMSY